MARKIRLFDTGEIVEKSPDLYYAPNKKWFSSYDAYLEYDLENSIRVKCIDKMYEILGLNTNQKINTVFFKRLSEWQKGYENKVILKAIELSEEPIKFALRTKDFNDDYAQMTYITVIIQNKLNDAQRICKFEKQVNQTEKIDIAIADDIECTTKLKGNIKGTNVSNLIGDL